VLGVVQQSDKWGKSTGTALHSGDLSKAFGTKGICSMANEHESIALQQLVESVDSAFTIHKTGADIRVCSSKSPTRVFLVARFRESLNDKDVFELIKHRTKELTDLFGGKSVSGAWITKFTQSNSESARQIEEITFENVPRDCQVIKETEVKKVVRDQFGTTVTVFKDGKPQIQAQFFDGTATRGWERYTDVDPDLLYDK
jgi:hypothetical protein